MADILSVLEEFKGVSDLYIGDIPEKKLKNALKNYGTVGDVSIKDETVVALIDCTVMGSAKSGIMFGDKTGIFHKNFGKTALLTYAELVKKSIDDIRIDDEDDYKVTVGYQSINSAGAGIGSQVLRDILIAIKQSSQDDYHQVGDNEESSEESVEIIKATRKKASKQVDSHRQSDDDLFGIAWREVEDGEQNQGLWARLFVENDGDADQTKVMYLKERVMELREEGRGLDNDEEEVSGAVNTSTYIKIQFSGDGAEISLGTVSEEAYQFWTGSEEAEEHFNEYVSSPDWFVEEYPDFPIPKGAELSSSWEMTDLGQVSGPFRDGSARMRILEMDGRYGANEISTIFEGTFEDFISENEIEDNVTEFYKGPTASHSLLATNMQGGQFDWETVDIPDSIFDPKKLKFTITDSPFFSHAIIDEISYDGAEYFVLDESPDSSSTDFELKIGVRSATPPKGVEYDSESTEIVVNYDPSQNETAYIVSVLDKIIDNHLDHFRKSNEFKVRPGYSYDKFYLDRVQGSFDQSLNGLIHHIMFQDGVYKAFLTDEQYESCKKVVEEEPESIWGPSDEDDDYDSVQDNLDDIYGICILHVHERLKEEGFQVDELDDYCEQMS